MMPKKKNPYAHSALFVAIFFSLLLVSLIFTIPFSDGNDGIMVTAMTGAFLLSCGIFMFILKDKIPKFSNLLSRAVVDNRFFVDPTEPDITIDLEKEKLLKKSTVRNNNIVGLLFFIPGLLLWGFIIWVIFFR